MQIIAQLIGFMGTITYFLVFQMKKRKSILGLNILAGAIFVLHFFLIGAYTGAAMNIVCSLRCVIYYYDDKKWARSKVWLGVFILASIVLGVYTWSDAYSVLPLISMILTSISFWLKRERNIRLLTLPSPPCWMLYNIHNGSISGFLTDTVIFISLLISLFRYDILKRRPADAKKVNIVQRSCELEGK